MPEFVPNLEVAISLLQQSLRNQVTYALLHENENVKTLVALAMFAEQEQNWHAVTNARDISNIWEMNIRPKAEMVGVIAKLTRELRSQILSGGISITWEELIDCLSKGMDIYGEDAGKIATDPTLDKYLRVAEWKRLMQVNPWLVMLLLLSVSRPVYVIDEIRASLPPSKPKRGSEAT